MNQNNSPLYRSSKLKYPEETAEGFKLIAEEPLDGSFCFGVVFIAFLLVASGGSISIPIFGVIALVILFLTILSFFHLKRLKL